MRIKHLKWLLLGDLAASMTSIETMAWLAARARNNLMIYVVIDPTSLVFIIKPIILHHGTTLEDKITAYFLTFIAYL